MTKNFGKICNLIVVLAAIVTGCSGEKELTVDASNPDIEYWGRIDTAGSEGAAFYWSGTSVKMDFEGTSVEAMLKDESGDNYFNIILDNGPVSVLRPDTTKQYYPLASGLSDGKHSVELFKRTEWDRGKTNFYGFRLKGQAKILPKPAPRKRKIEFYGNSITAGYAVEDTSGKDSPDSIFTNNYLSYAALIARHYDAEYRCICKSGIGITISWFPLIMANIRAFEPGRPSQPMGFFVIPA